MQGLVGGLRLLVAPKLLGAGVPVFAGPATTLHRGETRRLAKNHAAWPRIRYPPSSFHLS